MNKLNKIKMKGTKSLKSQNKKNNFYMFEKEFFIKIS